MTLEHRIDFIPAFDKRDADPSKNYGIGAMKIRFMVVGPKGAIQWLIGTGWYVRSAREHLKGFPVHEWDLKRKPEGYDLGYHAKEPQYEGQSAMDHCDVLGDGACFYDGSSLQAELPIEGFLSEGADYVWRKLEAEYRHRLEGDGEWPFREESADSKACGERF